MSKKKRTEKRQKAWQREMNLIGVAEFLPSCEDQETLLKPKTSVSDDESRCDLCGCTGDDLVEIDCSGETCMFCNELLHADADEPIT
ncbi:MAG TPA: hypothetical protein VJA22_00175, partial [Patescibacteria group bacterium]|nr:hypothetical protein [Patescibacteria group bacterium]